MSDSTTVLVVEDEVPIRLLVRVNLEAEGYVVQEAGDGVSALEMIRSSVPDVVLLDVMMPGKDGWDVAQEIRADPATASLPIIFLTARADLRDRARGIDAGALQYVTKPFNPRQLGPAIEACITAMHNGDGEQMRAEQLRLIRELQNQPE